MFGGLGLLHTEFKEFTLVSGSGTLDLAGAPFSNAPEQTLSLGFSWGEDKGFFANGNVNYVGSSLSRISGTAPRQKLDGYTTVDAAAGYVWDNGLKLTVYAKNLFDKEYQTYRSSSNEQASFGPEREIGFLVDMKF